jgi:hypothetical protein
MADREHALEHTPTERAACRGDRSALDLGPAWFLALRVCAGQMGGLFKQC